MPYDSNIQQIMIFFFSFIISIRHHFHSVPKLNTIAGYTKSISFVLSYYFNLGFDASDESVMANVKPNKMAPKFKAIEQYLQLEDGNQLTKSLTKDSSADEVLQYTAYKIKEYVAKHPFSNDKFTYGPPEVLIPEVWKLLWSVSNI